MKSFERDAGCDTSKRQRRTFTSEFKRELVAQTLAPGASVSGIALANGLNTNQLFAWRRKLLPATKATTSAVLLPVHLDVTGAANVAQPGPSANATPAPTEGHIEIALDHATVRLHGRVDHGTLRVVLQCLVP
ncbi:MAG: transposase-like protein [Burkholderia sp.]|nr:transposase-like protein [Burkholderia sp.]